MNKLLQTFRHHALAQTALTGSLITLLSVSSLGCSLARNSDRESFDNKAVKQTSPSGFTCDLKSENDPHTRDSNETLIEIACGSADSLKTIVRVSR